MHPVTPDNEYEFTFEYTHLPALVVTEVNDKVPLTYYPNRNPNPPELPAIVILATFNVILVPQTHPEMPPSDAATNELLHHVYPSHGVMTS